MHINKLLEVRIRFRKLDSRNLHLWSIFQESDLCLQLIYLLITKVSCHFYLSLRGCSLYIFLQTFIGLREQLNQREPLNLLYYCARSLLYWFDIDPKDCRWEELLGCKSSCAKPWQTEIVSFIFDSLISYLTLYCELWFCSFYLYLSLLCFHILICHHSLISE